MIQVLEDHRLLRMTVLCKVTKYQGRGHNEKTYILSLVSWWKLRRCRFHSPWAGGSVHEVCKTGSLPVEKGEGTKGEYLLQMHGCRNLNQMAPSFYIVTIDKCWISFLQHENVPRWCGWPKIMNHCTSKRSGKQVSVQEWGWLQLSSILRSLLLSMERPTGYIYCYMLHNFSFYSQQHEHLVSPESSYILTMQPLTKLTSSLQWYALHGTLTILTWHG